MPGTVTVACKMPNGLILELTELFDHTEPLPGGGTKTVPMHRRTGKRVTIAGPAAPAGMAPKAPVMGGYALTHGIDADFWKQWLEQNKHSDLVRNKMIFAHEKQDSVEGRAREQAELRSGLEPMSQERDPRSPGRVTKADVGKAA